MIENCPNCPLQEKCVNEITAGMLCGEEQKRERKRKQKTKRRSVKNKQRR